VEQIPPHPAFGRNKSLPRILIVHLISLITHLGKIGREAGGRRAVFSMEHQYTWPLKERESEDKETKYWLPNVWEATINITFCHYFGYVFDLPKRKKNRRLTYTYDPTQLQK